MVSQVIPTTDEELRSLQAGIRDWHQVVSVHWPHIRGKIDESFAQYKFFVEVGNKAQYPVDFILPETDSNGKKLSTVEIYSYFQRKIRGHSECRKTKDRVILGPGWSTRTLYDIPSQYLAD